MPFAEDTWQKISINTQPGAPADPSRTITLVSRCARCLVRPSVPLEPSSGLMVSQLPNVDPKTGVRDAAVPYKVIMKFRTGVDPENLNKPCFGSNGVPGGSGVLRVGDRISVHEWVPS